MQSGVDRKRILAGCCIYVSLAMGCMAVYVTSVAQLPDVYGLSITRLGTLGTLMAVTCMIGSAALVSIRNRIGARGCLYLGAFAMLVQAAAVFTLKGRLISLIIELISCGLVASLSAQTVLSEIIAGWYPEKRAEKIAIMLGSASFGSAFFEFLSGQALKRMDYFAAVSALSLFTGIAMLLLVHFVIRPEQPDILAQNVSTDSKKPETPSKSLYKSACFWFLLVATILAAGNTTYVLNYATMFFTRSGMDIGTAAFLLSLMSVCSGLFSLVSGKIFRRLGNKRFIVLLIGAAVAANLGMMVFERYSALLLIAVVIAGYGIGSLLPSVANLLCGTLFRQDDAMNAASKCYAAYAGTNILLTPACAAIIDNKGFSAAYSFVALLCTVSLIFYLLAIRKRVKRDAEPN